TYTQTNPVAGLKEQSGRKESFGRSTPQKDMADVLQSIFKPSKPDSQDLAETKHTDKYFSIVPAIGYTLQTGFAAIISANMAYYLDTALDNKLSSFSTSVTYSQYRQTIIPFQANIWTKGNRFNFITDFRYINYPSGIYGFGKGTNPN